MRSKSGPGGTLYHYGLCELAQRQAVFVRKDKPSDRAIKSYRAKVVMTAGCISRIFDIQNYIYIPREIGNSANQNLSTDICQHYYFNFVCHSCSLKPTRIFSSSTKIGRLTSIPSVARSAYCSPQSWLAVYL